MTKVSFRTRDLLSGGMETSSWNAFHLDSKIHLKFYIRYITRRDGSPIVEALTHWRNETLRKRTDKCTSPLALDVGNETSRQPSKEVNAVDSGQNDAYTTTSSQPVKTPEPPVEKPPSSSSSSWVQWWRLSRK